MLLAAFISLLRHKYAGARILLGISVSLLLLIAFVPIGNLLTYPLESRFAANPLLPDRVDGIIVLGGSIKALESYSWNQIELNASAERNLAFLELSERFPQARLLMTGGAGSILAQQYSEADVARDLFETLGIDRSRIEFERESRNTWENVSSSMALVRPQPDETWVLITSAMHMPRATGIFCAQNWHVLPWPVDHQTSPSTLWQVKLNLADHLGMLTTAMREWVGLLAYFATGKIDTLQSTGCAPEE